MECNINLFTAKDLVKFDVGVTIASIEHDLAKLDSSMSVTATMLSAYMDDFFYVVNHLHAPEHIRDHMCQKISNYLRKNYIHYSMQYEAEKNHIINKLRVRCEGIVKDIRKYKKDDEIQYFFSNINNLYTISFDDAIYVSECELCNAS